jgi:hypothetical protein
MYGRKNIKVHNSINIIHKFKKIHVSAPRRHLQGVSFEYKHQYISLGNTMPSIRIFKNIYYNYKIYKMVSIYLQPY